MKISRFKCWRTTIRSSSPSYGDSEKPKIENHSKPSTTKNEPVPDSVLLSNPDTPNLPLNEFVLVPAGPKPVEIPTPSVEIPIPSTSYPNLPVPQIEQPQPKPIEKIFPKSPLASPSNGAYGEFTACELIACERLSIRALEAQLKARSIPFQTPMSVATRHHYCRMLAGNIHAQAAQIAANRTSPSPAPTPPSPTIPVVRRTRTFAEQLERALLPAPNPSLQTIIEKGHEDATLITACFDSTAEQWREGRKKLSFCYLLIDPESLKMIWESDKLGLNDHQKMAIFAESIFYIGKAKKSRPHQHLKDAIDVQKKTTALTAATSTKTRRILDIWSRGDGVISLHICHNIMAVDAFTKEAAMIDAIDVTNLTNQRSGDYYGIADSWKSSRQQIYGVFLLHGAMITLLVEGLKTLKPEDVMDV